MKQKYLDDARKKRERILHEKRSLLTGCNVDELEMQLQVAHAATQEVIAAGPMHAFSREMDSSADGSVPQKPKGETLLCDAEFMEWEENEWWQDDDDDPGRTLSLEEQADLMAFIEAELFKDLEIEEAELRARAEQQLLAESAEEQDAVSNYYNDMADGNLLLCPVCKKDAISCVNGLLFCRCGVRLNTQADHITTDFLRSQLADTIAMHSQVCHEQPFFCVQNSFGIDGMYMLCNHCECLELVV